MCVHLPAYVLGTMPPLRDGEPSLTKLLTVDDTVDVNSVTKGLHTEGGTASRPSQGIRLTSSVIVL